MIVGGQTGVSTQLSPAVIDYHAPFDQGLRDTAHGSYFVAMATLLAPDLFHAEMANPGFDPF